MFDRHLRARNLAIAAVLGLAAALLTTLSVTRSQDGAKAAAPATAGVLVATRDLPVGTSASQALASGGITVRRIAASSVSPAALSSSVGLAGQVVTQPIFKGEQLVAARFGRSGTQGLGGTLRGSLRAIEVPGDPNQLLAGTLQQGDHVDVVANLKTDPAHPKARIALRNLVVLRAPDAEPATTGGPTASATLQLTDEQTQVLLWVLKNADWSFVLRPSSGATSTATAPATAADVLQGR